MRPSTSPPRIEPLSARTWQHIEEGLFEQLAQRSPPAPLGRSFASKWSLGIASLSLAASLFAVLSVLPDHFQRPPVVSKLQQPEPSRTDKRAPTVAPTPAPPLQHTLRIVTKNGSLERSLGHSRLVIAERSRLAVQGSDERGWDVALDEGSVHFDVAPRRGRPDFLVRTPDALVRVVGTRFRVTHSLEGTRVAVDEGKVIVEQGRQVVALGPGDSWPKALSPKTTSREKAEPPDPVNTKHTLHAPPQRRPRKPRRSHTIPREPLPRSPAEEFRQASSLEAEQPQEALRIYGQLVADGDEWAAPALYAKARLLYDTEQLQRARATLKEYRRRYPQGVNGPDVEELLKLLESAPPMR